MLEELRENVWACNQELPKNGLVKMTSGNVSGRDRQTNLVVIKPSGYSYGRMKPIDMVVVDLNGNVLEGHLVPSVDTETHLYIYSRRPDVMGIVHTHSTYASTFAALGQPIPICLTAATMIGREIPLGGYVPIGGKEIGEEVVSKIRDSLAIIMQNHGVFTIGSSPEEATKIAVEVEEIAKITHMALLRGEPVLLPLEQIDLIAEMYRNAYGQSRNAQ